MLRQKVEAAAEDGMKERTSFLPAVLAGEKAVAC
jgi:hypothetical protein